MSRLTDSWPPDEKPGIDRALSGLTNTMGVLAGVVAAEDGLPIAVRVRTDQDGDVWSAAAAAMGRIGRKVLRRLGKGELEVGVFDTDKYRLLVRAVRLGYLLAVCDPEANIGLVTMEMEAAAEALDRAATALVPSAVADPAYWKGAAHP
jgi:predicted regulator of Ras-like GTPase activity (Roadblock/LC7/MglB family)